MNKAFENIMDGIESLKSNKGFGGTIQTMYADGMLDKAKKIVQEVAEEYNGGWIACSERVPELDGTYICTCQGIAESITLIFSTHDNSWSDEFEAEYDDVIAWQPLPKPFKECD